MSFTSKRATDGDELSPPIEMEARPRGRGVVPPSVLTADMPPSPTSATPLITDGSSGLLAAASQSQTPGESPLPGLLSPTGPAFPQLPTLAAESLNPERNGAPRQPTAPQSHHEEQASEEWTNDLNRRASSRDAGDRGRAAEAAPQPQRWQRASGSLSASSRPYRGPPEISNRAPRARSAGMSPSSSPMSTGAADTVGHPPSSFQPGSSSSAGNGGGGGAAPPAARSTFPRPGAYLEAVDSPMPTQGEAPFLGSVSTISNFESTTNAAARSVLSAPDIPDASTTLAALPDTPRASVRWAHTSVPQRGVAAPPPLVSFPAQRASAVSAEQPVHDDNGQRTLSMTDTTTSSPGPEAGAGTSSVIMVASLSPQQLFPAPSSRRQQQRFQEERRTSRSTSVSQSENAAPGTAPASAASTPRAMDHIVVDNTEFAILRVLPEQRSHSTSRGASGTEDAASTVRRPSRYVVAAVVNNNSSTTNNNASTSHTQREVSRNAESADEIGWRGVADFASLASGLPPVRGDSISGLALLQQARIATTEERRVRLLFHNRPHVQLEKRPLVVTNAVLDRTSWEQPLCYLPLFFPCMRNTFYSVPLSTVMRTSWEADLPGPSQPSVAYSESTTSQSPVNAPAVPPRRDGNYAEVPRTLMTPTVSISTVYHVPITAPRPVLTRAASPHLRERQESLLHRPAAAPPTTGPNPLSRAPARPLLNHEDELVMLRNEVARQPLSLGNNVSHLLYRCFCVRCAIASQAQAMQADADMRAAHPTPFPCCTCLGVESKSYSDILCLLCVLDVLTLGVPCGCCCYHGLGSALYGWHLRYLLRARYRIFAWTSIDLLTTCCVPGLAVDQQGAELLLSGTPEATVGLQFMA